MHHRIRAGRLHRLWPGIYAVGRPQLTQHGRWMAAVLACGPSAALSHLAASALWQIRPAPPPALEVSVPSSNARRPRGIRVHRRSNLTTTDRTEHHGIPVTSPICTLIDLATRLDKPALEAAVNEADKLDLVYHETLRRTLDELPRRPGIAPLRKLLDRHTFTLTDSELERYFLPIARRAGLDKPVTRTEVNGFRVDFHWPDLGLVVETDGLRYHRTPAQQARDRLRDQTHLAAGLIPLRFTHFQIRYEPRYVQATLERVARRLEAKV